MADNAQRFEAAKKAYLYNSNRSTAENEGRRVLKKLGFQREQVDFILDSWDRNIELRFTAKPGRGPEVHPIPKEEDDGKSKIPIIGGIINRRRKWKAQQYEENFQRSVEKSIYDANKKKAGQVFVDDFKQETSRLSTKALPEGTPRKTIELIARKKFTEEDRAGAARYLRGKAYSSQEITKLFDHWHEIHKRVKIPGKPFAPVPEHPKLTTITESSVNLEDRAMEEFFANRQGESGRLLKQAGYNGPQIRALFEDWKSWKNTMPSDNPMFYGEESLEVPEYNDPTSRDLERAERSKTRKDYFKYRGKEAGKGNDPWDSRKGKPRNIGKGGLQPFDRASEKIKISDEIDNQLYEHDPTLPDQNKIKALLNIFPYITESEAIDVVEKNLEFGSIKLIKKVRNDNNFTKKFVQRAIAHAKQEYFAGNTGEAAKILLRSERTPLAIEDLFKKWSTEKNKLQVPEGGNRLTAPTPLKQLADPADSARNAFDRGNTVEAVKILKTMKHSQDEIEQTIRQWKSVADKAGQQDLGAIPLSSTSYKLEKEVIDIQKEFNSDYSNIEEKLQKSKHWNELVDIGKELMKDKQLLQSKIAKVKQELLDYEKQSSIDEKKEIDRVNKEMTKSAKALNAKSLPPPRSTREYVELLKKQGRSNSEIENLLSNTSSSGDGDVIVTPTDARRLFDRGEEVQAGLLLVRDGFKGKRIEKMFAKWREENRRR